MLSSTLSSESVTTGIGTICVVSLMGAFPCVLFELAVTDGGVVVVDVVEDALFDFSFATSLFLMLVVVIEVSCGFLSIDDFVTDGSEAFDGNSWKFVRVVVGPRIVEVLQTLGWDVISQGGLGRVVVADVCAAIRKHFLC